MDRQLQDQLDRFQGALEGAFGPRLLFLGLQGSQRRGEAREDSDIDLVVVLDHVAPEDLRRYRALVDQAPFAAQACGFLCGRAQLAGWPRADLFHLWSDTLPLQGDLFDLAEPPIRAEGLEAARIGAANLYHGACHTALYSTEPAQALPELYKGVFFILRALEFARTGEIAASKAALLERLEGEERAMLERAMSPAGEEAEAACHALMAWSGALIHELALR